MSLLTPNFLNNLKNSNSSKKIITIPNIFDTYIRRTKQNDSLSMAYQLNLSIFEHHIYYLETLCVGDYFSKGLISERLVRLEDFLPEIKTLVLKKTESTYFIIEALNSAKKQTNRNIICVLKMSLRMPSF